MAALNGPPEFLLALLCLFSVTACTAGAAIEDEPRAPRYVGEVLARGREVVAACAAPALAELGLLDVTQMPYGADPTGVRDSTEAIQRAVRDARDARLVCWFPAGRYLVSETIIAAQRHVQWGSESGLARDDFPCVLWGPTGGGRATIVLADDAPGFTSRRTPKPVLFFASFTHKDPVELQPNIAFNQMLVSVDVELGRGNEGAIGVDNQGAQGCVTEDVHVRADGALAGFRGAHGSGGGTANISVRGGRYGLYLAGMEAMRQFAGSQPCPTISNVTLTGQTDAAVFCQTRGPLTLVGADIDGAGIVVDGVRWARWNGGLNMVDSAIRCTNGKPAIASNRPVYLSNVHMQSSAGLVEIDGQASVRAGAGTWVALKEYAAGPSELYPVWTDGQRSERAFVSMNLGSGPPDDLRARHVWREALPAWNSAGVANVRDDPYAAAGDGAADDTDAIQGAIDASRDVFVPKGIYRITRPLRLRPDTCLFGLGVYSVIEPDPETEAFGDPANPSPMIASPDDPDATCTVAFLQLWARVPGAYAIHWQAGAGSRVRNVRTKPWPWVPGGGPTNHPMILIDGNGGGRWYNALMHYKFPQGPDHRHVLARGTRQRLDFYMLNPEHSGADHMVEFDDVQNVNVYGLKCETLGADGPKDMTAGVVRNSSGFRILGHGGNATAPEGMPLYVIGNCRDFALANFSHQPFQGGADPSTWFTLEERTLEGQVIRTPATEYFTLYRRQ